jgi:hypothetical protein
MHEISWRAKRAFFESTVDIRVLAVFRAPGWNCSDRFRDVDLELALEQGAATKRSRQRSTMVSINSARSTMHPMKTLRLLCLFFALVAVAFAANPTGTWQWTTRSPTGDIETSLKLEAKDGKLTGAYSNQFGDTSISNASLKDDAIAFEVVRDLGGTKYVVKYQGKIDGDTIKGTIEAPGRDGGEALKLDWNAKRAPKKEAAEAKPKP